jgi:hypothetical protein
MVDIKPDPDPTVLTTEALHRAINQVEEKFNIQLEVINEKFVSVTNQLQLVERQRVEQKADTQKAVDAALAAQKEAVKEQTTASERAIAKSEASTADQLKQLSTTFDTSIKGLTDNLNDAKDRIGKIENIRLGGKESTTAIYAFIVIVIAVAGFSITILSLK